MKLKNHTDLPDWFIRRMISWVCKNEWINWSTKKIRGGVTVRNRNTSYRRRSGHARPLSEEVVLSIGTADLFRPYIFEENENGRKMPVKDEDGNFKLGTLEEGQKQRIRQLVGLTGHEIAHLAQYDRPRDRGQYSESDANWRERKVLEAFKGDEEALMAAWMRAPAYASRPKKPKPSRKEINAQKAAAKLKEWERKLKLAKTKVKGYQAKVKRYEKEGVL